MGAKDQHDCNKTKITYIVHLGGCNLHLELFHGKAQRCIQITEVVDAMQTVKCQKLKQSDRAEVGLKRFTLDLEKEDKGHCTTNQQDCVPEQLDSHNPEAHEQNCE